MVDTLGKKDSHISHLEVSQGFGGLCLWSSHFVYGPVTQSAVAMEMIPIKHRKSLEMPLGRGAQDHLNAEGPAMS